MSSGIWIVVLAVVGLGSGVWWFSRKSGHEDDSTQFKMESFSDRVGKVQSELSHLRNGFLLIAGLNVVLLGITGLLTVQDHIDGPGIGFLVAGVLFGALPAAALIGVGHTLPGLLSAPKVPEHLQASADVDDLNGDHVDGEVDGARRKPLIFTVVVGLVSLIGSGLFALQHMIETTEILGFTEPINLWIFVIPPALLIPACIEFFQAYLLGASIVKAIDLAKLRGQAAAVRGRELDFQIAEQDQEIRLMTRQLEAEAEHGRALVKANASKRELEQLAQIEDEKRKAQQKTLVASAREAAEADLELERLERDAMNSIKRAEIQARIVTAERQAEQRIAAIESGELVDAGKVPALSPSQNGNGTNAEHYHRNGR